MKTSIAITLIVMGALLIMTPVLSDYLYQRNVVAVLAAEGARSVTLQGHMSQMYRFGCWLTGTAMIGIAVVCSMVLHRRAREAAGPVEQAV